MENIVLLNNETIDKIAAGEVIENPASIVKELVENAIDAKATTVTVEVKDGGMDLIRVTDNGEGIVKEQLPIAFLRHATSKIKNASDLFSLASLGFRGEALSSIAAVSETEVITKREEELIGSRYVINGGKDAYLEEVGAPNGTTFLVKNIFFNTPVRKKFLSSATTETSKIYNLMEHLALSKPSIGFTFIANGKVRIQTMGNGDIRQVLYRIYGKDISKEVFPIEKKEQDISIQAYLGTPVLNRGTRSFENLFVNGRYVHSKVIEEAIENAYRPYLMQHKFPFALVYITCNPEEIDVNIHPSKKEVRFHNEKEIAERIELILQQEIKNHSLVRETKLTEENVMKENIKKSSKKYAPEPFEEKHRTNLYLQTKETNPLQMEDEEMIYSENISKVQELLSGKEIPQNRMEEQVSEQMELFSTIDKEKQNKEQYQILGQVFDTYWIITLSDKLYFVDQHAAHEKVKYERILYQIEHKQLLTQNINPPIVTTLTANEIETLKKYKEYFIKLGFAIEEFGGNEFAIREIPMELFGLNAITFFQEVLDELSTAWMHGTPKVITDKIASMACKSAVKGNNTLSNMEMEALIHELMKLENPFFCPHGRPTIIALTKREVEKKFKRIL